MPNQARASFKIQLNGSEYILRPSFESIMEFTDVTDMDIFEALQTFQKPKVKIIVASIWAGIRGEAIFQGKESPTLADIGKECQAQGFPDCVGHAIKYLTRAVASDDTTKKLESEAAQSQE